jgi:hypothetical protein
MLIKEKLNISYKLGVVALLQYLKLVNHKESKIKASICIV